MDELKPCPFCGGKVRIVNFMPHRPNGYWQGLCSKCGIKTKYLQTVADAETAINRRHAQENVRHLLDTIHDLRNEHTRLHTEIERILNTAPENKPLTLDQLRQMDGEPVKVYEDGEYQYGLVSLSGHFLAPKEEVITLCSGNFYLLREMVGNFEVYPVAYARKPEQEATT